MAELGAGSWSWKGRSDWRESWKGSWTSEVDTWKRLEAWGPQEDEGSGKLFQVERTVNKVTEVSCPCHGRFRAGSPKLSLVAWWEPLVHKASTLSGTPHSHSLGPDMSGLEKTSCILQIDLSSTLTYGLLTSPLALYLDTGFILDCNFSFTWLITSDYSSHQR